MALAMPSRFACLKIEGESETPKAPRSQPKPAKKQVQQEQKPTQMSKKKQNSTTSSSSTKKANNKKKKEQTQQWEEWKQRDNDLVDEYYEKDLQNAILLSKLDYEQEKTKIKENPTIGAGEKKKKNKTMSLEQFNNLISGAAAKQQESTNDEQPQTDFFEQVDDETKIELTKDKISQQKQQKRKPTNHNTTKNVEDNFLETYTLIQCRDKLEQQMKENALLRSELDKAKEEVQEVKKRNKRLCNILGHGEMKEKADVLIELERLGNVKDELTEEVTRLHQLLEQERSKVAALQQNKAAKKKPAV